VTHLQLIKFWPSRAPGKGVCGGGKIFWLRLTTTSVQCLRLSETWWDCAKNDMESLGLSQKDAQSRNKWRRRINGVTG